MMQAKKCPDCGRRVDVDEDTIEVSHEDPPCKWYEDLAAQWGPITRAVVVIRKLEELSE